uniref:C1q domain-containing protein n=1 Tax=Biomphalaria glabrata TaxID=6526 RepID=A0A2C9L1X9_BIOGL
MTSRGQLQAVSSQLEVLKELEEQLYLIVSNIQKTVEKGNAWLRDERVQSFMEMNQFLTNETSHVLSLCIRLAIGDGNERLLESILQTATFRNVFASNDSYTNCKDIQSLVDKYNALDTKLTFQSHKLERIEQEMIIYEDGTCQKLDKYKEDCMLEFQGASYFMGNLLTETETLSLKVDEMIEAKRNQNKKFDELDSKIKETEHMDEKLNTYFAKRYDELTKTVSALKQTAIEQDTTSKKLLNDMVTRNKTQFDDLAKEVKSSTERNNCRNDETLKKVQDTLTEVTLLRSQNKTMSETIHENKQKILVANNANTKLSETINETIFKKYDQLAQTVSVLQKTVKEQEQTYKQLFNTMAAQNKTQMEDIAKELKSTTTRNNLKNDVTLKKVQDTITEVTLLRSQNEKLSETVNENKQKIVLANNGNTKFLETLKKQEETLENVEKKCTIIDENSLKLKAMTQETTQYSHLVKALKTHYELLTKGQKQLEVRIDQVFNLHDTQVQQCNEKMSEVENKQETFQKDITLRLDGITTDVSSKGALITSQTGRIDSLNTSLINVAKQTNVAIAQVNKTISEVSTKSTADLTSVKVSIKKNTQIAESVRSSDEAHEKKIENISMKIEELTKRISVKENKEIGFEASVQSTMNRSFQKDEILAWFQDVEWDLESNYNPDTGIFTVPVKGIYMCELVIGSESFVHHKLQFCVCVKASDEDDEDTRMAMCAIKRKGQLVCTSGLRRLNENDQVYVKSDNYSKQIQLHIDSRFMCLRLDK